MKTARTGILLAALVAAAWLLARPYVSSWNDATRLAAADSLAARGTWRIDESVFALPYPEGRPAPRHIDPESGGGLRFGTLDKLQIDGHFYSDKSPVPLLVMGGQAEALESVDVSASRDAAGFSRWMAFLSAGLPFAVAVVLIFRAAAAIGLSGRWVWASAASFAAGSVALAYARQVNSHIQLLAVQCGVVYCLARYVRDQHHKPGCLFGSLLGLGYTIDLAAGPALVLTMGLYVIARHGLRPARVVAAAGLPWVLLHHGINYALGGSILPLNMNPDYLAWPGSPFGPQNMTGPFQHATAADFFGYAIDLLGGQRGILGHNPVMWLALGGGLLLLASGRHPARAELAAAFAVAVLTWLLYAAMSNNYSGVCCSVRWFVPLLAPGYFVLAVFLRDRPDLRWAFWPLAAGGVVMAGFDAWAGPWSLKYSKPAYWYVAGGTYLAYLICLAFWLRGRLRLQSPRGEFRGVAAENICSLTPTRA